MTGRKIKTGILLFIIIALLCACTKDGGTLGEKVLTAYGNSGNMRYGGKAEGRGDRLYYVWKGVLKERSAEAESEKVIDDMGASYLCLADDGLYYRSVDENKKPGIYRWDGTNRSLVLETQVQNLYAVGDWLYFIDSPGAGTICRVKKNGTESEVVFGEKNCEMLIVDNEYIYFKNTESGNYYRIGINAPSDSGAAFVFENCGRDMPILESGFLYYSKGESYISYRMRLSDMTEEQLDFSIEQALIWGETVFTPGSRIDLSTGGREQWHEGYDSELIGIAGNTLLYRDKILTEETRLQYFAVPDEEKLMAYSWETGEKAEFESSRNEGSKGEERQAYENFLLGDITLLQNESGYIPKADIKVSEKFADLDRDGIEELFLQTENAAYLFHYENGGIYCWGGDNRAEGIRYELLSDNTFLIATESEHAGYKYEAYTLYSFAKGGRKTRIKAYQSMEPETEADSLYFIDDEAVEKEIWKTKLEEEILTRLFE